MPLFQFDIDAEIERRNDELLAQPVGYNKVVLGGIVLAVDSITPAKTSFEVEQRSWLKKIDMGIRNSVSTTYKDNSDGSKSVIKTTITTSLNGTVTKKTVETVHAIADTIQSETEALKVPLVDPNSNLELDGTPKALWLAKAQTKITNTVTTPSGNEVSYVTTETITDPEDPKTRCRTLVKNTNEQKPLFKPRPIRLTSITGKIYDQTISPAPPQGIDTEYWNDEMYVIEETEKNETVRNGDGTETSTKTESFRDADGLLKTVETIETIDLEPEDDDNTTVEKTEKSPGSTVVTTTIYDKDDTQISQSIVTTSAKDVISGVSVSKVTTIEEVTTDAFDKVTRKTTIANFNPDTEVETVEETEEVLDAGSAVVTYNRSISRDLITGVETLSETITETDGYGVEKTRTRNSKTGVATTVTNIEETTAEFDDDIVDDLVKGKVINEYIIKGKLMSMNQVVKIREKADKHLAAWAFINVTKAKLGLGDRLSPLKRQQLYREMQKVFLGETNETVRGGPVLDRIGLYAWGEVDVPVVFAPTDGFEATPIVGTIGLFEWSMRVQRIELVERAKENSFREGQLGGVYGRSDAEHNLGGSVLGSRADYRDEIDELKDTDNGGLWQYN